NGNPDKLGIAEGAFQLSGELVIFDRFRQSAIVISNVFIPEGKVSDKNLKALYQQAERSIARQIEQIRAHNSTDTRKITRSFTAPTSLTSRADYLKAVRTAKEHMRAGDIIQVVLSQRWSMDPKATPFQIYRALRLVNPSPYMYCVHFEDTDIVGSSPELLV